MALSLMTSTFRVLNTLKRSTNAGYGAVLSTLKGQGGANPLGVDPASESRGRKKSRLQLVLLSAAVCGIEFCYAAETAFVTPVLLQIGVPISYLSLVWGVSPLLGIFLVPVLGSLSDQCSWSLGRRRPFILLLSAGIVIGLLLVPNGAAIGKALGDNYEDGNVDIVGTIAQLDETTVSGYDSQMESDQYRNSSGISSNLRNQPLNDNYKENEISKFGDIRQSDVNYDRPTLSGHDNTTNNFFNSSVTLRHHSSHSSSHPWSLVFTMLGVVLLDLCCDACQSPCRAYMLDVCVPEDHATGLTTFTLLAGAGGSLGYVLGGIDWESTNFGESLGGHVRVVFLLVLLIFIVCVSITVSSFKEVPLSELGVAKEDLQINRKRVSGRKYKKFTNEASSSEGEAEEGLSTSTVPHDYGSIDMPNDFNRNKMALTQVIHQQDDMHKPQTQSVATNHALKAQSNNIASIVNKKDIIQTSGGGNKRSIPDSMQSNGGSTGDQNVVSHTAAPPTMQKPTLAAEVPLRTYLRSIVRLPKSLFILCLTNLFCWMSLVCYSLYFTDFVGQAVYHGDPSPDAGKQEHERFERGVRVGSLAMSLYSMSCSIYSLNIERLVDKFGARRVYVGSQLVYTVGAVVMAAVPHPVVVVLLSTTSGVMYATLFTMPYLLVAHYHTQDKFSPEEESETNGEVRGLGTDIAVVSSMVFLAQVLLSLVIGSLIHAAGTTRVVMATAAVFSTSGAVCATQVVYMGL